MIYCLAAFSWALVISSDRLFSFSCTLVFRLCFAFISSFPFSLYLYLCVSVRYQSAGLFDIPFLRQDHLDPDSRQSRRRKDNLPSCRTHVHDGVYRAQGYICENQDKRQREYKYPTRKNTVGVKHTGLCFPYQFSRDILIRSPDLCLDRLEPLIRLFPSSFDHSPHIPLEHSLRSAIAIHKFVRTEKGRRA